MLARLRDNWVYGGFLAAWMLQHPVRRVGRDSRWEFSQIPTLRPL